MNLRLLHLIRPARWAGHLLPRRAAEKAPPEGRFMESHPFFFDLLTRHEPVDCSGEPPAASSMRFGNSAATNGRCKRLRSALTPSLSPGEREDRSRPVRASEPRLESTVRRVSSRTLTRLQKGIAAANGHARHHAAAEVPPLLGGEGWGEGESRNTSPLLLASGGARSRTGERLMGSCNLQCHT